MNLDIDKNSGLLEVVGKFILAGIALNVFAIFAICQIFYYMCRALLEAIGLIK